MPYISLAGFIDTEILGARSSVGKFAPDLMMIIPTDRGRIVFDFSGIKAVSPSALDELLTSIYPLSEGRDIQFSNMASGATWKFEAIARAHGRMLIENGPQSWVLAAR